MQNYKTKPNLFERIKNSELNEKLKHQLLVILGRACGETQKGIQAFLDYVEHHPQVREWLKSATVVGVLLEVVPFSRLGLVTLPGFVPGAVVGFLKGATTGSQVQSAVVGGLVSWPLKPVITLSPLVGLLLTALAAGHLEEILENAVKAHETAA
jgi:hypothetical protein